MPIQALEMVRDPVGFLERCQARYGDVFQVKFPGVGGYVYVADAKLAREVFATDRTIGRVGEVRREFLAPLVGESSLLCLEDEKWLSHRKLIGPAFHRRRVEGYEGEIDSIAAQLISAWPTEGTLQIRGYFQQITLEVILRVVFGFESGPRMRRMRVLLPELIETGSTPFLALVPEVAWRWLDGSAAARRAPHPLRRFLRLRDEVDSLIHEELNERCASGIEDRSDVLSVLLDSTPPDCDPLSGSELRDELITLLVAGHETTATALAWAIERLVRSPRVLRRLSDDIERGDEEYLEAVVKESLRARPVVLDTPRRLTDDLTFAGYVIPAGWYLAPALPLVQRSPQAFADPDEFRPERFLEHGLDAGWIPFGGGKRHCVGSHFALLELKVILRVCLQSFDFAAVDAQDERAKLQHVTLVPAELAKVRVRRKAVSSVAVG